MIDKAHYVAVNDYEGRMLAERTGVPLAGIAERVEALIVTLGADGSVIHAGGATYRDSGGQARGGPRSHRLRRRLSRRPALRHRAGLGLGAHRRPRVGAGRAEDRVARRAEPRGQPGDGGRAVPRDVRRALCGDSAAGHRRRRRRAEAHQFAAGRAVLPLDAHLRARARRASRTTMFVFPLVSDTRRRALVKRWSARLLRILAVDARVDGELGAHARQRAGRRQSHLVARHLRAQRRASGALRREVGDREVAGRVADDPRRGHGVHRARAAARHASRQPPDGAACSRSGDVVAIFPEGTTTDGTELLPFKSSLLQPIVEAEGHVQPVAIRYRTPDGDHRAGARVRRRHVVRGVVLARVRRTRADRRADRAARAARARPPSARPRARGGSVYPNGFGCTGERDGT